MTKGLICGSRDYRNAARLRQVLDAAVDRLGLDEIVQGGQVSRDYETGEEYGADHLAKVWGEERRIQVETFYADWENLGSAAGPIRNAKMLRDAKPDFVIAFPVKGAGNRGTIGMIELAREAGVTVHVIDP